MAAGAQLLDVNTGQPVNNTGQRPTSTQQSGGSVSSNATDTTSTTTTQSNQQQTQASSALNTTPGALAALEALISQLSDRPAISEEELNAKAPMATPVYTRTGPLQYYDPLSGRYMGQTEALSLNNARKAERAKLTAAAGVVSGGTAETKKQSGERATEISRNREQQGVYSKDAAFADSKALIDKAIADALEAALPQITAAAEGAGTSKGTFQAEAVRRTAVKAGTEGAALGANLALGYGQISNQLASTLELLTRSDPNGPAGLLLQALGISKVMVQNSVTSSSTTGTTTQTTNQSQAQAGAQASSQQVYNDYSRPLPPVTQAPSATPATAPAASAKPSAPTRGYLFAQGDAAEVTTFDTQAQYATITSLDDSDE